MLLIIWNNHFIFISFQTNLPGHVRCYHQHSRQLHLCRLPRLHPLPSPCRHVKFELACLVPRLDQTVAEMVESLNPRVPVCQV